MRQMDRPEHKNVRITEGFWKEQLDRIHHTTVWDVLDKFEHDHEAGIMKNYEWVAQGERGKHIGPPWYDGLICEVIRGVSDIIAVTYDEKLDQRIEFYAEKIEQAQDADPDGYLSTYTTLMCPDKRWGENGGSLIWQHELYNMGCLAEAGIHYYKATGKIRLLKCAIRAADCMCAVIGPAPRKNIVPAHSLAEEAMVKLCRLLRDEELSGRLLTECGISAEPEKYLELARFWMDHRGVHTNRASFPRYMGEYSQDHCRIEDQSEAVGHAVRAALMYTGLAAVGIETGEEKYLAAARRIWDNVEQTKLHISGGIGAIHNEERFGYQYDLPNDAYLETCAGVALAFWAGEMYRAFGESRYMDVFECALYNNVLPGLSADGVHYFYENPLISDGTIERWSWHGCPCCPPMFLKLMGCLQDYIYASGEGRLAVNLHIGSRAQMQVNGRGIVVEQKNCGIPYSGSNTIALEMEQETAFTLEIRRPAWAGAFFVTFRGKRYEETENGYVVIRDLFRNGDEICVSMELLAMKIEAHPYVSADEGRVALMRGPLLYCLEETDNPQGVDVTLGGGEPAVREMEICRRKTTALTGACADGREFVAVPYFLWCNREKGRMNVWLLQEGKEGSERPHTVDEARGYAAHLTGSQAAAEEMSRWDGRLYRRYLQAGTRREEDNDSTKGSGDT